jgi:hypothetical protein
MEIFVIGLLAGLLFVFMRGKRGQHEAGPNAKQCPDCAEWARTEAKICWRCRHEFPAPAASRRESQRPTWQWPRR